MSFSTPEPRSDTLGTFHGPRRGVEDIAGLGTLWRETLGTPRICVAILDTPVDRSHPSLEAAEIEQHWLGEIAHCSAHGTEVASVILAAHHAGLSGIAPGCRAVSIPIFECDPGRGPSTHQQRLAGAICEALSAGAQLINVSAGEWVRDGRAHPDLIEAVRACAAAGVLIVSAAGNEGCDCLHVPAALPCVLAVGAMGWDGNPLPGSNWGATYGTEGILALGENIPVAGPNDGGPGRRRALRTGTSYATAIVTGVAALLLSRELKRGRPVRPLLIRIALLAAAAESAPFTAGEGRRFLAGRLNIPRATQLLDTWSDTMTDEMNVDLAIQCATEANAPCETPSGEIRPAGQLNVALGTAAPTERAATSATPRDRAQGVVPSACGCGCQGGGTRQLVYALGRLDYDFGNDATLDAFKQQMAHEPPPGRTPLDPAHLREFLTKKKGTEPWHASAVLWILKIGDLPIYVIRPEGPYDREGYELLQTCFNEQYPRQNEKGEMLPGAELLAVPGVVTGKAKLLNGLEVPVLNPDLRGVRNWNVRDLVQAAKKTIPGEADLTPEQSRQVDQLAEEFLHRIYFELRNSGRLPQERALNYAGTNLCGPMEILEKMLRANHALDAIQVVRSTLGRPGSDCWDVIISFFNPQQPLQTVRWIHRFTVDVSEVIPVTVGDIRSWKAR
jgi:cyanobactin maturation PatA/PatG family protease